MSARTSVYQSRKALAPDRGKSPNAFVGHITAEVRVFFPPVTVANVEVAMAELADAYDAAMTDLLGYVQLLERLSRRDGRQAAEEHPGVADDR